MDIYFIYIYIYEYNYNTMSLIFICVSHNIQIHVCVRVIIFIHTFTHVEDTSPIIAGPLGARDQRPRSPTTQFQTPKMSCDPKSQNASDSATAVENTLNLSRNLEQDRVD